MRFDVQQVCLSGHQITDSYNSSPECRQNFCTICGSQTISKCPNCLVPIKGRAIYEKLFVAEGTLVPNICEYCGASFPWNGKHTNVELTVTNNVIERLNLIADKFLAVYNQMQRRHAGRATLVIKDEYDVQDLFQSLLRIFFDDVRAEEWNPSYAGSSTRSDFLIKNEGVIVEVKCTRPALRDKHIGEQLVIDIAHYRRNQNCKVLYCLIYDKERLITNPKGLQNDLEITEDDFKVIVRTVT